MTNHGRVFRLKSEPLAEVCISSALDACSHRVFGSKEILSLINEKREEWGVLAEVSTTDVFEHLCRKIALKKIVLQAETHEKEFVRYLWRDPSAFEVAASLRSSAYVCHSSAVYLHGLTAQMPKVLHVNTEQSPKPKPSGGLTQEGIDRAFKGKQRSSTFAFKFAETKIVLLNGKNTSCLGVEAVPVDERFSVRATNLERTLIDITVRPAYAGGVKSVLEAYRHAKPTVSLPKLTKTLSALDYAYPYHQAVGFYLERAGCCSEDLLPLKALGLVWDFYIAHGMSETRYDPAWKLHYPKHL